MPDDAVIKIKLIGLPARALAAESFEGDDWHSRRGVLCVIAHIMHCLFCILSRSVHSFPRFSFRSEIYVCIYYVQYMYMRMCTRIFIHIYKINVSTYMSNPLLLSSSLGTILSLRKLARLPSEISAVSK